MIQKIIVNGILCHNSKVFIAKRASSKLIAPGKWHLAGGHVEFGENPEDAIIREFQEEFDLAVVVVDTFRTFSYIDHDDHTVGITFILGTDSLTELIKFNEVDTQAVNWISGDELDGYFDVGDHDYITLHRYFFPLK